MKIGLAPGEYASRALVKDGMTWKLTDDYFISEEEVMQFFQSGKNKYEYKWPVDIYENGFIYVPTKEEMEEK